MVTLLLEIINPKSNNIGFYNPSAEGFKKFPRSENGVKKAIVELKKTALNMESITDFRIAAYDGKKEYYNSVPLIGYISKETILNEF